MVGASLLATNEFRTCSEFPYLLNVAKISTKRPRA
jgi:hypothetical protein